MLGFRRGDAGLYVLDVAQDLLVGILDRTVDDNAIAEPLGETGRGVILGIKFRECLVVAAATHRGHRIFGFLRRYRANGNPGKPFVDVERPVGAFAELAVADNVDADLGLPAHDFRNRIRKARFERRFVISLAVLDRPPERDELWRPDQAADVSGENAIAAVRHDAVPVCTE